MLITLRRNWYLIAAGVALVLAAFYLWSIAYLRFSYSSDTGFIIYPAAVLASSTCLSFLTFILFAFIGAMLWSVRHNQSDGKVFIVLILAVSLLISASLGLFNYIEQMRDVAIVTVMIFAIIALAFVTLLVSKRWNNATKSLLGLGMMLFASIFSCVSCGSSYFVSLEHRDSVQFKDHVYQLALVTTSDFDPCSATHFGLYECDSRGLICHAERVSFIDACVEDLDTIEARLVVDSARADVLFVEINGERVYAFRPREATS